ncbi:MAG: 30S ribosomal protein S5 [Patescibacteria group bacterium]
MSEEKKQQQQEAGSVSPTNNFSKPGEGFEKKRTFGAKGGRRFSPKPKEEFEQRILDVARVTRVMKGGKRMSFRVCIAIGDKKGRVAVALGKGADVTLAVNKAVNNAKKDIVEVPIYNDSIPHEIRGKFGSAKIILKPSSKGRGVIAGGVVRVILDLAGVKSITCKILGTNNKVNNAKCTVMCLSQLKKRVNIKDKEVKKEVKKTEEKKVLKKVEKK